LSGVFFCGINKDGGYHLIIIGRPYKNADNMEKKELTKLKINKIIGDCGAVEKVRLLRRPDKLGLLAMTKTPFSGHCERPTKEAEAISNAEYRVFQQPRCP